MKLNPVKIIVSIFLAALVGLLCYYLIGDKVQEMQKWVTFGVSTVTMLFAFGMAFGVDYNSGNRNANIHVVAYLGTLFVLASNILFVSLNGPMIIYVVVTVSIVFLCFLGVYSIYRRK